MPRLNNTRHELFAQALALGKTADEAYREAGYRPDRHHASRLATNGNVRARVSEIMAVAAEETKITLERIVRENVSIGLADIRKLVKWQGLVTEVVMENEETGEPAEMLLKVDNRVTLMDSDKIDDATAAAISEISQTKDGCLRIKMHPKQPALNALMEYLRDIETHKEPAPVPQHSDALNVLQFRKVAK